MNKRLALITAAGIGAGAMYMLDPDRGARRRALLRDKAVRFTKVSGCTLGKFSRDLSNRAVGAISEFRDSVKGSNVPDSVLVDRIKSQLGRHPVHHRASAIAANEGVATLTGEALAHEVGTIVSCVSSVRGVKDVVNNLMIHENASGISSLQGHPVGAQNR